MPDAEGLALELRLPGEADPVARIVWEPARAADAETGETPAAAPGWRFQGEPGWERLELVRVLGASFDDGTVLAIAAARPAGAQGHGEEAVAGVLLAPEEGAIEAAEVLLSTEYGPDGRPRRLGVELYEDELSPPRRVAGDVLEPSGEGGRLAAAVELRMDGVPGTGLLEVVRPG
jgi:hypothetical protein